MLGSLHDAEDALQNALLRSWRGLAGFEGRSSLRSWLYRIATNSCLRMIERRPKRVLPVDYGPPTEAHGLPGEPLAESVWLEPLPDGMAGIADGRAGPEARYEQRESVELAFVAALQHLPARQRAVLILRDVLGFAPAEIAEALDTSAAAVSSALQRAHKTIDDLLPERSQQATLRALGDERLRGIVETYVDAWERADVDAILAMLTEDAAFAMPPRATWFRGQEAVGAFLRRAPFAPGGPLAARRDERRRPAGLRHLSVGGRALGGARDRRPHARPRRADHRRHRVHRRRGVPPLRAAGRVAASDGSGVAPGSLSTPNPPRKDRRGTQTSLGRRPHRRRLADGGARHARRGDRPQHHPHRPRRVRRPARMDRQRLQPQLRRAADDGRRARRPLRPAPLLRGRRRALHASRRRAARSRPTSAG